jgi:HD-GYP domain-containing protein (c-di-GMP phosphodiesterase class II)
MRHFANDSALWASQNQDSTPSGKVAECVMHMRKDSTSPGGRGSGIEGRRTPLSQFSCLSVALNVKDAYTQGHCNRVESLAFEVGKRCGLNARELVILRDAAALHDVGKIGIPDHILLKPGRFEPDEWAVMKTHSELGAAICLAIPRREMAVVANIVRHHHESFDGSGYPDQLSGEGIPIHARVLSVVDSYDAMATARPYHAPKNHAEVMKILVSECGHKIDPHVFKEFEKCIANSEYRAP